MQSLKRRQKKMAKRWTNEELSFIEKYGNVYTSEELASEINAIYHTDRTKRGVEFVLLAYYIEKPRVTHSYPCDDEWHGPSYWSRKQDLWLDSILRDPSCFSWEQIQQMFNEDFSCSKKTIADLKMRERYLLIPINPKRSEKDDLSKGNIRNYEKLHK